MLARDIEHLRQSFASDKGESGAGKLILRNEHASKVYTVRTSRDCISHMCGLRNIGTPGARERLELWNYVTTLQTKIGKAMLITKFHRRKSLPT